MTETITLVQALYKSVSALHLFLFMYFMPTYIGFYMAKCATCVFHEKDKRMENA